MIIKAETFFETHKITMVNIVKMTRLEDTYKLEFASGDFTIVPVRYTVLTYKNSEENDE